MIPPFASPSSPPDVLIVAGEHSGDEHAARMVASLLEKQPSLKICALGGPRLQAAGAELLFDLTDHSVVGLFEVLKNYGFFKNLFEETLTWVARHQPRLVCFVDYPGFNLRLARELQQRGLSQKGGGDIRLVYYIGPQIWAWKQKRRFAMAKLLDALAVIFPFEVDCYADTSLPVSFVGHPFVEPGATLPLHYDPDGPVLLLPGSRLTPVKRILPVMLRGMEAYHSRNQTREFCLVYPSDTIRNAAESILEKHPGLKQRPRLLPQGEVSLPAAAVLTSSGTMSLQVALAGIPGAIVYRANPLTYLVGRSVIKIRWLGIANILLGRNAWPEYIQGAARPGLLADELEACLDKPGEAGTSNPDRLTRAREDARQLKNLLGDTPGLKAASWLEAQIDQTRKTVCS